MSYINRFVLTAAVVAASGLVGGTAPADAQPPYDPSKGLALRGTIVSMDDRHTVLEGDDLMNSRTFTTLPTASGGARAAAAACCTLLATVAFSGITPAANDAPACAELS
jgi:hypothetical protein